MGKHISHDAYESQVGPSLTIPSIQPNFANYKALTELCNDFVKDSRIGFKKLLSVLMIFKRWKLMNIATRPDWTLIGIISGNRVYDQAIGILWLDLSFFDFTIDSVVSCWISSTKHCSRLVPILRAFGFRRMIAGLGTGQSNLFCTVIV